MPVHQIVRLPADGDRGTRVFRPEFLLKGNHGGPVYRISIAVESLLKFT